MPCFYCGKRVSLVRQLTDADFCSDEHRKKYHELTRAALNRLVESHEQMVATPPLRRTKVEEPGEVVEEQAAPAATSRALPPPPPPPTKRPRREEPIRVVAPPPPPEPEIEPEPAAEPEPEPVEADFVWWIADPTPADAEFHLGSDYLLWTADCDLERCALAPLSAGFPLCTPIWPDLDPDTLRQPGRMRFVTAVQRVEFRAPALDLSYLEAQALDQALRGVLGGGFRPLISPRGIAGALHRRAPAAASAADFPIAYYLPAPVHQETVQSKMPSPGWLSTALPRIAKRELVAIREAQLAGFAAPEIWLPEAALKTVGFAAGPDVEMEAIVADWIQRTPRPLTLPLVPRSVPTPVRSPRMAIVQGPNCLASYHLPPSQAARAPSPQVVGARKIVAAMARRAEPAVFLFEAILPSAEGLRAIGFEAPGATDSALAVVAEAGFSPLVPAAPRAARSGRMECNAAIFAVASPALPDLAAFRLGGLAASAVQRGSRAQDAVGAESPRMMEPAQPVRFGLPLPLTGARERRALPIAEFASAASVSLPVGDELVTAGGASKLGAAPAEGSPIARRVPPVDAAACRRAHKEGAPIQIGEAIHTPQAHFAFSARLSMMSAGPERRKGFPNPWVAPAHSWEARALEFPIAAPEHVRLGAIVGRCTLTEVPPWRAKDHAAMSPARSSPGESVEIPPRTVELPGPPPFRAPEGLMQAGVERVSPRSMLGPLTGRQEGWQGFEHETAQFQSAESQITAVVWPTPWSNCFQRTASRLDRRMSMTAAAPVEIEFPYQVAVWPESARFAQHLGGASLHAIPEPARREDSGTMRAKVHLSPVFRPVRRPNRFPVFRAGGLRASMPLGVFTYAEMHEDFDDFKTMALAAIYDAPPLEPVFPAVGQREPLGGDMACWELMPVVATAAGMGPQPIGAPAPAMQPARPLLPADVEPIPMEWDPALSETAKRKGLEPLVGAFKSASKFFKFMTLGVPGLILFSLGVWSALGDSMMQTVHTRAAVRLEERFQSEMQGWFGGDDWGGQWSHDQGGFVKVGPLALYRPSMKMRDYRMEFLAQIGQHSLGWVYRAADLQNYYATRILVTKRGPDPSAVLERYAVIEGVRSGVALVPLQVSLHDGQPYRVQLQAFGDGFTTRIEGRIVDFWSDARLREGGVGFFSDSREDRPRLYWVRVAYQDDFWGKLCARIAPG